MTDPVETDPVELFPVAIGVYDNHPHLDVDREVTRLAEVVADLGAQVVRPWDTPMADRGSDAVTARLLDWAAHSGGPTVLYWLGHGWSNVTSAALAHARSPAAVNTDGISPEQLADKIVRWGAEQADRPGWLLVVIDACQSARFAELLAAALDNLQGPRRVAVLGTSGSGATTLGRFTDTLATTLRWTFADQREIPVGQLCDELARTVPGSARRVLNLHSDTVLRRRTPVPTGYTGPLDIRTALSAILAELSDDERRHFLPKAQGGDLRTSDDDLGEVSWFFTGREQERQAVLDRLAASTGELIVVTGRAGAGKSALLGDILVRSRPELAAVLHRHHLLDPIPAAPPAPFDSALHLTGLDTTNVIARLCRDLELDAPDPSAPLTARIDQTARALGRRPPSRILVDALDEAVDPLTVAHVLRTVAVVPGVRLVVGTRRSTNEGPDQPDPDDTDLLDALGETDPITLTRDPEAITRYVVRRLAEHTDGATASRAAASIAATGQEFLYARLATHELIAQPDLLDDGASIPDLIGTDHRSVFATAVRRLTSRNHAYRPLLHALALAQGRGAPIRDGIWVTLAQTVTDDLDHHPIANADIVELLADAAPYLALDTEHEQTVYRPAHRTFAEHLTAHQDTTRGQHRRITNAAITAIRREHDAGALPNDYWLHHTSAHAARGGLPAWKDLDGVPDILDLLDPDATAGDAMRSLFGYAQVPPNLAGVIGAAHQLRTAHPFDRPGLRQLATARHAHLTDTATTATSSWSLSWANIRQQPLHLTLAGHTGGVLAVAAVGLPDGRTLLATGGGDGTVRLWDPARGTAVGQPLTGHTGRVVAVAAVGLPDGRPAGHRRWRRDGSVVGPGARHRSELAADRPHQRGGSGGCGEPAQPAHPAGHQQQRRHGAAVGPGTGYHGGPAADRPHRHRADGGCWAPARRAHPASHRR